MKQRHADVASYAGSTCHACALSAGGTSADPRTAAHRNERPTTTAATTTTTTRATFRLPGVTAAEPADEPRKPRWSPTSGPCCSTRLSALEDPNPRQPRRPPTRWDGCQKARQRLSRRAVGLRATSSPSEEGDEGDGQRRRDKTSLRKKSRIRTLHVLFVRRPPFRASHLYPQSNLADRSLYPLTTNEKVL